MDLTKVKPLGKVGNAYTKRRAWRTHQIEGLVNDLVSIEAREYSNKPSNVGLQDAVSLIGA